MTLLLLSDFVRTVALARFIVTTVSTEAGSKARPNVQPECIGLSHTL